MSNNDIVLNTVDTAGSGGGGGDASASNQTDGSQKTQIVDPGGEAATVTGGKLDVNASVDTTGLALAANQQTDALTDTELRATAVPVSGTVAVTGVSTAAKQDTIIGHIDGVEGLLTTIDTDTGTIATEVAGLLTDTELRSTPVPVSGTVTATPTGTQNVDVTANTIGLATSAKQDTIIGHVDGLETAVASTNTKLDTANTSLGTLDNAISGNEMQVDVVGALPAGTNNIGDVDVLSLPALPTGSNAIGKLAANSGIDIGDVDVTSTVLPAGAATSSVTSEADSSSSVTLKSSNSSRKQIIIQNTSSAILYVKYGTTATTSDFTVLLNQNDTLIEDRYTGRIDGIWATDPGNGAAKVTEIT